MAKGDTVERILAQVRAAAPSLSDTTLIEIASRIYADLGGDRHWIPKNPTWGKARRLDDATAAGVPFAQAWKGTGISRATAYRIRRRRLQMA